MNRRRFITGLLPLLAASGCTSTGTERTSTTATTTTPPTSTTVPTTTEPPQTTSETGTEPTVQTTTTRPEPALSTLVPFGDWLTYSTWGLRITRVESRQKFYDTSQGTEYELPDGHVLAMVHYELKNLAQESRQPLFLPTLFVLAGGRSWEVLGGFEHPAYDDLVDLDDTRYAEEHARAVWPEVESGEIVSTFESATVPETAVGPDMVIAFDAEGDSGLDSGWRHSA